MEKRLKEKNTAFDELTIDQFFNTDRPMWKSKKPLDEIIRPEFKILTPNGKERPLDADLIIKEQAINKQIIL